MDGEKIADFQNGGGGNLGKIEKKRDKI